MVQDEAKIERERQFHDERFAQGETRGGTAKFYRITGSSRERYRRVLFRDIVGKNVLEYGCGPGGQAFDLAASGASVTGIDISPVAIQLAQNTARERHLAGANFTVMDAERLAFDGASFDRICGTGILHHLDLGRTYGELARVLRPSGEAVFVEPLGHNPLINLYRRLTPNARTMDEHPLLLRDIKMAAKYFSSVRVTYYHLSDLAGVPVAATPIGSTVTRTLGLLDRVLFKTVPFLRRYAWIVVLQFSGPRERKAASPP